MNAARFRMRMNSRVVVWLAVLGVSGTVWGGITWVCRDLERTYAARSSKTVPWSEDFRFRDGAVMVVGGGSAPAEVERCFMELAGGPQARVVVIPGTIVNDQRLLIYEHRWLTAGAKSCYVHPSAETEPENQRAMLLDQLSNATGVWLGGGDQAFLASRYGGSSVETALRNLVVRGGVVAGTSAGAAIMSRVMISSGWDDGVEGRGFGLLEDVVVDQHFFHRNRLARLERFMRGRTELVALGVDESTAVVVGRKGQLAVLGKSYVLAMVPPIDESASPRWEVLKSGDWTSLSDLRDAEKRVHSPLLIEAALE